MGIDSLTRIWYMMVSLDHHKDRDCHWKINIRYSYGEKPTYTVRHSGYVYKNVKKTFNSLKEAENFLRHTIWCAIKREYQWAKKMLAATDDWDSCDLEGAQNIINLLEGNYENHSVA